MQQILLKQAVLHFLDGLPEDVTFDDIHYGVYVLWKIDQGLHDAESGRRSHARRRRRGSRCDSDTPLAPEVEDKLTS